MTWNVNQILHSVLRKKGQVTSLFGLRKEMEFWIIKVFTQLLVWIRLKPKPSIFIQENIIEVRCISLFRHANLLNKNSGKFCKHFQRGFLVGDFFMIAMDGF